MKRSLTLWSTVAAVVLLLVVLAYAQSPDDIYWDTTLSPSASLVTNVMAATVYNGQLVAVGNGYYGYGNTIIASWDGSKWLSLWPGINGKVMALTAYDGRLIAGGSFYAGGGANAYNIAAWNGTSWFSLGEGLDNWVNALTVYDNKLIAGGTFRTRTASGDTAFAVAVWDGTSWSPLGLGIRDNSVYNAAAVNALTVYEGRLIAGGVFTTAGGATAKGIASWDGSSWSSLGSGLGERGFVRALAVCDGDLIAGGWFIKAGDDTVMYVSSWNGSSWSPLGAGLNYGVLALASYRNKLIAGGEFKWTGNYGLVVNRIAAWDGQSWSPLGSGVNNNVNVLTVYDGQLIVGGAFGTAGKVGASGVASWDGSSWSSLGLETNGPISTMTTYGDRLMAGGRFTSINGVSAHHIASWNGSAWSPLGSGICAKYHYDSEGGQYEVTALNDMTVFDGQLIAGGEFDTVGGVVALNIAAWNGSSWAPIDTGMFRWCEPTAFASYDSELVVGYYRDVCPRIGCGFVGGVYGWDGIEWALLHPDLGATLDLEIYDNWLFALNEENGGMGDSYYGLNYWDGSSWSVLLSGTNFDLWMPRTLAVFQGNLVVGGWFDQMSGTPAKHIASWDGTSWSSLGAGINGNVRVLTIYDGRLVAGGIFDSAGGVAAKNIAAWDGASWQPLGSGVNGEVTTLCAYADRLAVGGRFTTAGDKSAGFIALWTKHEPTDVQDQSGEQLPVRFAMQQNYPNPFNSTTSIEYSVPNRAHVTVEIFNLIGQHVKTLVDEMKNPGKYKAIWDGTDVSGRVVSTGVYLYRFRAGDHVETNKMLLLK